MCFAALDAVEWRFDPHWSNGVSDIHLDLLERVSIASPCPARWEDMAGDAVARHCASCDLDVFNLSAMTRDEANAFLRSRTDGRLCARLYRRADGTVLTRDCPAGLAAARARVVRAACRAAAALVLLIGGGVLADQTSRGPFGRLRMRTVEPIRALTLRLYPGAPYLGPIPGSRSGWTGGVVALPIRPPAAPTGSAGN
jgi:hypothetical protein